MHICVNLQIRGRTEISLPELELYSAKIGNCTKLYQHAKYQKHMQIHMYNMKKTILHLCPKKHCKQEEEHSQLSQYNIYNFQFEEIYKNFKMGMQN